MSWKTKRSTYIGVVGDRVPGHLPFGEFVELFRLYLVDVVGHYPDLFSEGLFFAMRNGSEPARFRDPNDFVELAIKLNMSYRKLDQLAYRDASSNSRDHLEPDFFTSVNSLPVYVGSLNGSPKISFTHDTEAVTERPRWGLTLSGFPPEMPEGDIQSLIDHAIAWWPDPRSVRVFKAPQVFKKAVKAANKTGSGARSVYWKNWHWGQSLAEGPLPEGISQYEAHGGVWTVVDGAEEAPADPTDPLVTLCAEATRISAPRR